MRDEFLQARIAAQLDKIPPLVVGLRAECEGSARLAVQQHHFAATAGHHHCIGHAAQDRFEFVALLGQRVDFANHAVGRLEQLSLRRAHHVAIVRQHVRGLTMGPKRGRQRLDALGASADGPRDRERRQPARDQPGGEGRNCAGQRLRAARGNRDQRQCGRDEARRDRGGHPENQ